MRLRLIVLLFLCIITIAVGCMPTGYGVKHSYAYWQAVYPGNIPVRVPGMAKANMMDTITFVYLETTNKAVPVWDTAWRNGIGYSVNTVLISSDSVAVGTSKDASQPFFIKVEQGNRLWQVSLGGKITDNMQFGRQTNTTTTAIMLAGDYRNKRITVAIPNSVELQPQRRP